MTPWLALHEVLFLEPSFRWGAATKQFSSVHHRGKWASHETSSPASTALSSCSGHAKFKDAHYDRKLRSRVAYHVNMRMGLLGSQRYRLILARAAILKDSAYSKRAASCCCHGSNT